MSIEVRLDLENSGPGSDARDGDSEAPPKAPMTASKYVSCALSLLAFRSAVPSPIPPQPHRSRSESPNQRPRQHPLSTHGSTHRSTAQGAHDGEQVRELRSVPPCFPFRCALADSPAAAPQPQRVYQPPPTPAPTKYARQHAQKHRPRRP
jgi:hypothetical protein